MMETAMPVVKPLVTGQGMNLMRVPIRANPITTRIPPAISVAKMRPEYPYFSMINRTIGMNAAVGPPICTRLPPRLEITRPAKIAVNNPTAGGG